MQPLLSSQQQLIPMSSAPVKSTDQPANFGEILDSLRNVEYVEKATTTKSKRTVAETEEEPEQNNENVSPKKRRGNQGGPRGPYKKKALKNTDLSK